MNDNTNENSQNPSENGNDLKLMPTPPLTNSSVVRDFLYLDQPKVLSYLSQLNGGLQQLVEQVEQQFKVTDKSDPELVHAVQTVIRGELTGKVPLIADGTVAGERTESNEKKKGGDRTLAGRLGARATQTTIHHEAFEIVLSRLSNRFKILQGKIVLIDYDDVIRNMEEHENTIGDFNIVTGQKLATAKNTKNLARLVSRSASGKVTCILSNSSGNTTAFLNKRHLNEDISVIIDNYGANPSGIFTLVGIETTSSHQEKIILPKSFSHASPNGDEGAENMLGIVMSAFNMHKNWKVISKDSHIYPIALYKEL